MLIGKVLQRSIPVDVKLLTNNGGFIPNYGDGGWSDV